MHDKFLADKKELTEKDAVMREKLAKGTLTQEQYKTWRKRLENRLKRDTDALARILGGADQLATDDVNMQIPEFYSEAENYQTYETEQETGIDTDFSLVNKNSITRAMYGEFFADIDLDRNTKWNQRRIQSAITQGIIAGESIPKIADRLKPLVGSNEKSAIRNARTWTGAAVSGGRQESAEKSNKAGADMVKWWSATLDLRTRISHRHLDRTHVEVDEKFANGGLFPCDPKLPPAERYNCRCDVIYYPRGFEPDFGAQEQNKKFDMSYEEWKNGKDLESKRKGNGVVDGKDISGTWERRADKFDFEIEDVMNAQGFDGLPKVVSDEEFDKAVKESNLVIQRTYGAPDKGTLDMYQRELYKGKWYVDCSVGGSRFGQGMYGSGNYGTTVGVRVKADMEDYSDVAKSRGCKFNNIETYTMDKSAKFIRYDELANIDEGWFGKRIIESMKESGAYKYALGQKFGGIYDSDEDYDKYHDESVKLIKNMNEQQRQRFNDTLRDIKKKAKMQYSKYDEEDMDMGVAAVKLGYDGIIARENKYGFYLIALNRTKIIFKRSKK